MTKPFCGFTDAQTAEMGKLVARHHRLEAQLKQNHDQAEELVADYWGKFEHASFNRMRAFLSEMDIDSDSIYNPVADEREGVCSLTAKLGPLTLATICVRVESPERLIASLSMDLEGLEVSNLVPLELHNAELLLGGRYHADATDCYNVAVAALEALDEENYIVGFRAVIPKDS